MATGPLSKLAHVPIGRGATCRNLFTLILILCPHLQNWHCMYKRRRICTSDIGRSKFAMNQSLKPGMQKSGLENQECPSWFGRSMFQGGAVITKRLPAPHCAPKIPTPPPRIGQSKFRGVNPSHQTKPNLPTPFIIIYLPPTHYDI